MKVEQTYEQQAYEMGVEAAKAAASWIIDGNTEVEFIGAVLEMMDNGDPQADDYLPATPNLSGEWADDMTPARLADEILGDQDDTPELIDALCEAYERGVDETFVFECERILRAAIA